MGRTQKITGDAGEKAVCSYLAEKGFSVIERNYRIQGGEIDIIAVCGGEIHFVEVKSRKSRDASLGLEAIGAAKQKRIIRAALKYCSEHIVDLQPCFDAALVCIDEGCVLGIDYYENAFSTSDPYSFF